MSDRSPPIPPSRPRSAPLALPALPATVSRLLDTLSRPHVTAGHVAGVVERDPGLSARLLRLANAPAYGFPCRIRTVQHAVALLGIVVVRGLAVGGAIFDRVADGKALWSHSYAVGLVARQLAEGRGTAEEAFTAGLLHDVGSVVLALQYPLEMRRVLDEARARGVHHAQVEREILGFDHAEAGGSLLRAWSLPGPVVEAVALHHQPGEADGACLVHVADVLVDRLGVQSGYPGPAPVDPAAWRRLGVDGARMDALKPEVERLLKGMPSFE